MNASVLRRLNSHKRRILRRIENKPGVERHQPMLAAANIHYEIADRTRAIAPGGIGAIHLLARRVGLVQGIDEGLHLLKRHLPYHESDHVLNIAYNLLAGGSRLEHIEVRRNDEVYLDALGAERIPDPTTAGDFCRRFTEGDVERLMGTLNETRLRVWGQQPDAFFDEAFRERRPQPVGPAGDDHDLVLQVQIHQTILAQRPPGRYQGRLALVQWVSVSRSAMSLTCRGGVAKVA